MSDNPFADLPPEKSSGQQPVNPYQPSQVAGPSQTDIQTKVLVPATILLALATISVLLYAIAIPTSWMNDPQPRSVSRMVGNVLPLVMNLVIIIGAVHMMRLKSYSSAMTAAVLAVIPLCSPCVVLGIPFGIWALVVLSNADVKAAFRE